MKRKLSFFRGLRAQLILWTILPLTLILIGIAFTGVYSHERYMGKLVEERDRALAELFAGHIERLLHSRADALHTLAHLNVPPQYVQATLPLFDGGLAARMAGEWRYWPDEASWSSRQTVLEELAAKVRERGDVVYPPPSHDTALASQVLFIGMPAGEGDVLVGAVSLEHLGLADLLSQARVGQRGVVYLIDGRGRILVHSDRSRLGEDLSNHSGVQVALSDDLGFTLCTGPEGERMALSYAAVPLTGWRVIVEEPWEDFTAPILRLPRLVPLVAVLAVVVALSALFFGVRYVSRPLQALAARAGRVTWGDFSAIEEPVGGVEEIEKLQKALQEMAARIQRYQAGMRDYMAAITQGQEAERTRLARELHDDTAQALIALGQRLQMAQRALARGDVEQAQELLVELRRMSEQTLEGVRRFSRDLRPVYLEELGFLPALEMLVRDLNAGGQIEAELKVWGRSRRLPPDLELAAYRIAQEALNNAARHAQAKHVMLRVAFTEEALILTVHDDGEGFEVPQQPDELSLEGHFGLAGMRERAILLGGQLRVTSTAGEGTTLEVTLPVSSSAEPD